jgi:hypothetical protein
MNHWWARTKILGSLAALLGSFVLSAVTWIGIGGITGYGTMRFVMPAVVDAYIVCAISIGMSTDKPKVARSAYYHALSAAIIGTVAQAVFHCATIWSETHTPWKAMLAFVGGGLPPSFAFLSVHLLGMDRQEMSTKEDPTPTATTPTTSPPATNPVLILPRPPKPTPTVAKPESAQHPVIAPQQPPTPPAPPRPVSVPTTPPVKRSPRIKPAPATPKREFPQRLKEWEIQAIFDGLDKKLPYEEIGASIGRSARVVQKYAAERRKLLEEARSGNGRVSQR